MRIQEFRVDYNDIGDHAQIYCLGEVGVVAWYYGFSVLAVLGSLRLESSSSRY